MQSGLAREGVGEVFTDFVFRDREAFDAKGKKLFAPLLLVPGGVGFWRGIPILAGLDAVQPSPAQGGASYDFLIQKIGGNAWNVAIYIDGKTVGVLVCEKVAAGKRVGCVDSILLACNIVWPSYRIRVKQR